MPPKPETPKTGLKDPVLHDPVDRTPSNTSLLTAKPRAKSNWLKVGAAAAAKSKPPIDEQRDQVPMIEFGSNPSTPSPSVLQSARSSIWENAVAVVATPSKSRSKKRLFKKSP